VRINEPGFINSKCRKGKALFFSVIQKTVAALHAHLYPNLPESVNKQLVCREADNQKPHQTSFEWGLFAWGLSAIVLNVGRSILLPRYYQYSPAKQG